jgi:hypothetical protein
VIQEVWKAVAGWEGFYEVSDAGRVRSLDRVIMRRGRAAQPYPTKHRGRLLKLIVGTYGYPCVNLYNGECGKLRRVHQIVIESFRGPRPAGSETRHLDGNKCNSALSNLVYGTSSENKADNKRHGLDNSGERNGSAKLSSDVVGAIRQSPERSCVLARRYGVSDSLISLIRRRRLWRHAA